MKQIILIKQSTSIQLAHLYEHIFCTRVDALFYDNDLFPHLDYELIGRTHQRGIVYVSLRLHTDEAEALASRISNLRLSFDQNVIPTAASQLIAEKEYAFDSQGYDVVKGALEELDEQPWSDLETIGVIDTKGIRRKAQPFYIAEGMPLVARRLTVSVSVDLNFADEHRDLLPLFRQMALVLSATLQNTLSDKYGYYSNSDSYYDSKKRIGIANIFKIPNGTDVDVEDNMASCKKVVDALRHRKALVRLARELRQTSFHDEPDRAPNPESTFIDTGLIVGAEGWKRIATVENCELLLKNMSIELKYGRNTLETKGL